MAKNALDPPPLPPNGDVGAAAAVDDPPAAAPHHPPAAPAAAGRGQQQRRRVSDDGGAVGGDAGGVPANIVIVVAAVARDGRSGSAASVAAAPPHQQPQPPPPPPRKPRKAARPCPPQYVGQLHPPPSKRAKTTAPAAVDPLKKEIQDLLEKKLMGSNDDNVKVEALQTLCGFFTEAGSDNRNRERKRWVVELQGGYVVLMLLRLQLDKCEASAAVHRSSASRKVVSFALRFLYKWNYHSKSCRDDTSKFGGTESVVRAMQAFPSNRSLQRNAIVALLAFLNAKCGIYGTPFLLLAGEERDMRLREVVEAGSIVSTFRPLLVATTRASSNEEKMACAALCLLGHLCHNATNDDVEALHGLGAVETFAKLWNQYHQKQLQRPQLPEPEPQGQQQHERNQEADAMAACRNWFNKLTS